jgi:biopolymer transport protein ExbD
MGGDVAVKEKPQQGGGLRRKKSRVRIRIDMTPMVDVAFLLLIFFMVTTVFRQPQALEMNLPPADNTVQVAESNVLTLFVDPGMRMFHRTGRGALSSTTMKELNGLFIESAKLNPELVILVKVSRKAPYAVMVDLMDELEIAQMTKFSLVAMSEEDANLIGAQP